MGSDSDSKIASLFDLYWELSTGGCGDPPTVTLSNLATLLNVVIFDIFFNDFLQIHQK